MAESDIELDNAKKDLAAVLEELVERLKKANLRYGGLDNALLAMEVQTKKGEKDSKESHALYRRLMAERKKEEMEIIKAEREGKITRKQAYNELKNLNFTSVLI